jgi:hypothetical protein
MTTLKPPFKAKDMDGLYKKVIKGSYSKIPDSYSKNLSNAINQCFKSTLLTDQPQLNLQKLYRIKRND